MHYRRVNVIAHRRIKGCWLLWNERGTKGSDLFIVSDPQSDSQSNKRPPPAAETIFCGRALTEWLPGVNIPQKYIFLTFA